MKCLHCFFGISLLLSMMQDTLISEVLIISMLIHYQLIQMNIFAATPGEVIIPAPTMDTFATSVEYTTSDMLSSLFNASNTSNAVSTSSFGTVNAISFRSLRIALCTIISTLTLAFARAWTLLLQEPGLSSKQRFQLSLLSGHKPNLLLQILFLTALCLPQSFPPWLYKT